MTSTYPILRRVVRLIALATLFVMALQIVLDSWWIVVPFLMASILVADFRLADKIEDQS